MMYKWAPQLVGILACYFVLADAAPPTQRTSALIPQSPSINVSTILPNPVNTTLVGQRTDPYVVRLPLLLKFHGYSTLDIWFEMGAKGLLTDAAELANSHKPGDQIPPGYVVTLTWGQWTFTFKEISPHIAWSYGQLYQSLVQIVVFWAAAPMESFTCDIWTESGEAPLGQVYVGQIT